MPPEELGDWYVPGREGGRMECLLSSHWDGWERRRSLPRQRLSPDPELTSPLARRFLKLQEVGDVHNINLVTPEQ